MTDFKPGDRFVVTCPDLNSRGKLGTVTKVTAFIISKLDDGSQACYLPSDIYPIDVQPEPQEKSLSEMEQAQLFLGKKVLVKDSEGRVLRFGRVVEVKQGLNSTPRRMVRIALRGLFEEFTTELLFSLFTFEEVE